MLYDFFLFLAIWIFCGLIAYSGMYADCSRGHGTSMDSECCKFRWFAFLIGPIGLFAVAIATRFFKHGLRFK